MKDHSVQIEEALNLEGFSSEEKDIIIYEIEYRIGSKPFKSLPEGKFEEFKKILYDDIGHIDWWLNENEPDFRDSQDFKDTVDVAAEDGNPDNIRPEKIYATIRWIEKNIPDYEEVVQKIIFDAANEDWRAWLDTKR